jgi:hypothetical protein
LPEVIEEKESQSSDEDEDEGANVEQQLHFYNKDVISKEVSVEFKKDAPFTFCTEKEDTLKAIHSSVKATLIISGRDG